MNRTFYLSLMLTCLALAAASCSKSKDSGKTSLIQTKMLDAHTTVVLKDAWIFGSSNQLLRAKFTFEGRDPNDSYNLKAALRPDERSEDIKSIYVWYVGLTPSPVVPTNRTEMIWEFKDFPTNTPNIYLREYYTNKITGQLSTSLDFVLPGTQWLRLRDAGVD
jgi:hypothetical protein